MHPSVIDETGNRYGRLVVLRRVENIRREAAWLCQCDCGNEVVVRGSSLRSGGGTRSCGCLHKDTISLSEGEAAFNQLFIHYKASAKKRGLEWDLAKEKFRKLTKEPCHYCGIEPLQVYRRSDFNGDYTYNGIDRKNNDKGYTPDNVVPCCWECNQMKRTRSEKEFIEYCEKIVQYQNKGG